jgi:hypothetical protein
MERFTKFFTSLGGVLTSLAAVVGGVAALYLAFGGGDEGTPNNPNPPTVTDTTSDADAVADWREQAEKACQDFERRGSQLGPIPPATDLAGQVGWLQQVLPFFESAANEIRALDEPEAIQEDVEQLLDSMDNQVALSQTMINAFQVSDAATFNGARLENQAAAQETNQLAAELGLRQCVDF